MEQFSNSFFFVWLVKFWKKHRDKSKILWLAQLFKHFIIKIQFNKGEQEKKNDKESMIFLTPKPSQSFLVYYT